MARIEFGQAWRRCEIIRTLITANSEHMQRTDMKLNDRFVDGLINTYLILSIALFTTHILAPLLGGEFLVEGIVTYGSWVGMAVILRYSRRKIRKRIKMSIGEVIAITVYFCICTLIWFSIPAGTLLACMIVVGNIFGYRAQRKWVGAHSVMKSG